MCNISLGLDQILYAIDIVCTVVAIVFSAQQAKKAIMHVFTEQKHENALTKINELPDLLNEYIRKCIELACATVDNNEARCRNALKAIRTSSDKLRIILVMYSSNNAVAIFERLCNVIHHVSQGKEIAFANIVALTYLIAVDIRRELTEKDITLDEFINIMIPEISNDVENIRNAVNKYVVELKLPAGWKA